MEEDDGGNCDNVSVNIDEPLDEIHLNTNDVKKPMKKPFSDHLMAQYLQRMWDDIDNEQHTFSFISSEGTAPRSNFHFYPTDIKVEVQGEVQREVITYVDPDELGYPFPSEGYAYRETYLKPVDDEEELDDYNDESIVSSPIKVKDSTLPTEFELRER